MQLFHYDTIDSTNDQARRLLRDNAIAGTACIIARAQTAGRGTRGRQWISPRDAGIYMSIVERRPPHAPLRTTTLYTVAAGIACAEALRELTGLPVALKPVNDLYCAGAKLGGILTESVIEREGMTALIIGIGINVRCAVRPLQDAPGVSATDLEQLLGPAALRVLPNETLWGSIAEAVRKRVGEADSNDIAGLRNAWTPMSLGEHDFPPDALTADVEWARRERSSG